ncbi:MAG: FAD-linked oxidase C-terminal domain-containing protein [Candidatus Zixiibacteriota bacterium]
MNSLEHLRSQLSNPANLITALDGHDAYFHDATTESEKPIAIVMAESEADVIATVSFCARHSIPIVPRGAGTGLSGGCIPHPRGIVLSTERLRKLEINTQARSAKCGPGVITKQLMDTAASHGLAYPPDPASMAESTLGGNVAEGAGGLRCKRFGVTEDYVLGLQAVTADGKLLLTGSYSSGGQANLTDLLIASEGTLAVITEIEFALIPRWETGITILAAFNHPRHAAQTVADITSAGIIPTVLEFLDGDAAECSNQYEKIEGLEKASAILLIETAGPDSNQAGQIKQFCEGNHSSFMRIETDTIKVDELWRVRRNLSKAVKAAAKVRISEDVAVPNSKFPDLVAYVAEMNRVSPLRINSFGHAGDGNLHVNFMSKSDSPADMHAIEAGIAELMRKTLDLGGTLTGEHGIGTAKRPYLAWEFDPPTLDAMRAMKAVFDPAGLLNPGKLL